ncbi:lysine N(6)-hydroxylase/L-ornithine N(5)-oxygenase family protein [Streptomyces sp. CO7]
MGQDKSATGPAHYRCVGVGVGPANLSLASLLHELPDMPNLFLDRRAAFGWHDDQQIPGTTLQVSMFKDLVSLADPRSPFSFMAYLHEQGRVYHFLNAQFDEIPRREWRNYLAWASSRNPNIRFGESVQEVDFHRGRFVVRTDRAEVTADNVVVGVGSRSWVPEPARPHLGPTQFHVNEFLSWAHDLGGKRVVVVGGGQSGAEAVSNLISRSGADLPRRVSWISRRRNYFPIDDTPFTNDYYMPDYADHFYRLQQETRLKLNVEHILTSDGISGSTLREIYQRIYVHRFIDGRQDLIGLHPCREVTEVSRAAGGGWDLTVRHADEPGAADHFEADVVVWATGFRPAATEFLAPIAHRLERSGDELRVDEDYAVHWDGPADRSLFVQNAVRGQRGLADPNLSLNAWRSRRIADRLCGVRADEQLPSFVEWSTKAAAVGQWEA